MGGLWPGIGISHRKHGMDDQGIVFILDGEEWALSKNKKTDTWSLMPAAEARPVEMDYSK